MADTSKLYVDPELMETMATNFSTEATNFQTEIDAAEKLTEDLTDVWSGESSQKFYDQFQDLKPQLAKVVELMNDISAQIISIKQSFADSDSDIASQIGVQ